MSEIELYIEKIMEQYSDIKIESYKKDSLGQNNDVIIINDNFIFRFPKYKQGIRNFIVETTLISIIKDYVSLEIPYPIYKSLEREEVGEVFIGYKKISGEPLLKSTFGNVENKKAIADQLASFLQEIHNIPIKLILSADLRTINTYHKWQNLYKQIKEKLFSYMREDAKQHIKFTFTNFLDNKKTFQPTLVHGDFGPTNILYNKQTQKISGIIDFGSVRIDDPAIDLASLIGPFGYGEAFIKMFEDKYPNVDVLIERAKFYASTFALQDALFGLENGDEETFMSGIKDFV